MRVLVIDGNNLFARAWFFLSARVTGGGYPPPALVISRCKTNIVNLRREFLPDFVVLCWDGGKDTVRMGLSPTYKAGRDEKPPEYKSAIQQLKEACRGAGGYESLEVPGVEADDLIGTVSRYFDCSDNTIIIASDDKDMFQLLSNNVVIKHSQRGNFDRLKFVKEFNFNPPLFADFLAIKGDDVDNIPGAQGIGDVGAKVLVQNFGTVEDMFAKIDQVPSKYQKKLLSSKSDVLLSKKLTVLKTVDLDVDWMVF